MASLTSLAISTIGGNGTTEVAYTGNWAGKPSAASAGAGAVIVVTGVGPSGRARFVSDGTYWLPFGGYQCLYQVGDGDGVTGIGTLTGSSAIKAFRAAQGVTADGLVPGGMLFPGARLWASADMIKAGTDAAAGFSLYLCADPAAPTANELVAVTTANSNNGSGAGVAAYVSIGSGKFRGGVNALSNTPWRVTANSSAANAVSRTDANVNTADRYIVPGIDAGFTTGTQTLTNFAVFISG